MHLPAINIYNIFLREFDNLKTFDQCILFEELNTFFSYFFIQNVLPKNLKLFCKLLFYIGSKTQVFGETLQKIIYTFPIPLDNEPGLLTTKVKASGQMEENQKPLNHHLTKTGFPIRKFQEI